MKTLIILMNSSPGLTAKRRDGDGSSVQLLLKVLFLASDVSISCKNFVT